MSYRLPPRSRPPPPPPPLQNDNHRHQEPIPHKYVHHHNNEGAAAVPFHPCLPPAPSTYRNSYGGGGVGGGCMSDDTSTYYEYFNEYRSRPFAGDGFYSEDSGSTRLPLYESDDAATAAPNLDTQRRSYFGGGAKSSTGSNTAARDFRRVYPTNGGDELGWGRMYHEVDAIPQIQHNPQLRGYRPQSSLSSAVGSTVVDGCGGKCQTCENVCYFFLQLVFTMGILIGISLCIAGTVLRKSAARNLQVLVYIGVLVALVSALLLGIQCNARKQAKNRKKAMWTAKRAPIPLDTLNIRTEIQSQPLMENRRVVQVPQASIEIQRQRNYATSPDCCSSLDEQGIPWWRRKDLRK